MLWQHVCNIKYIYEVVCQNNIVRLDNIVIIEFYTQIIRLPELKHGLCLSYCVSRTPLRIHLTMCDVCYVNVEAFLLLSRLVLVLFVNASNFLLSFCYKFYVCALVGVLIKSLYKMHGATIKNDV